MSQHSRPTESIPAYLSEIADIKARWLAAPVAPCDPGYAEYQAEVEGCEARHWIFDGLDPRKGHNLVTPPRIWRWIVHRIDAIEHMLELESQQNSEWRIENPQPYWGALTTYYGVVWPIIHGHATPEPSYDQLTEEEARDKLRSIAQDLKLAIVSPPTPRCLQDSSVGLAEWIDTELYVARVVAGQRRLRDGRHSLGWSDPPEYDEEVASRAFVEAHQRARRIPSLSSTADTLFPGRDNAVFGLQRLFEECLRQLQEVESPATPQILARRLRESEAAASDAKASGPDRGPGLGPGMAAIIAAVELKHSGLPVSLMAACRRAKVDRKNLERRHPSVVQAIKKIGQPDHLPPRATWDRRSQTFDGVWDAGD